MRWIFDLRLEPQVLWREWPNTIVCATLALIALAAIAEASPIKTSTNSLEENTQWGWRAAGQSCAWWKRCKSGLECKSRVCVEKVETPAPTDAPTEAPTFGAENALCDCHSWGLNLFSCRSNHCEGSCNNCVLSTLDVKKHCKACKA